MKIIRNKFGIFTQLHLHNLKLNRSLTYHLRHGSPKDCFFPCKLLYIRCRKEKGITTAYVENTACILKQKTYMINYSPIDNKRWFLLDKNLLEELIGDLT